MQKQRNEVLIAQSLLRIVKVILVWLTATSRLYSVYTQALVVKAVDVANILVDYRNRLFLIWVVSLNFSTQMNYLVSSSALQCPFQLFLSYFVWLFFPSLQFLTYQICYSFHWIFFHTLAVSQHEIFQTAEATLSTYLLAYLPSGLFKIGRSLFHLF